MTPGSLRATAARSSVTSIWASSWTKEKSCGVSALLAEGRVNTAISSSWSRYSRMSTGGSFSLTFMRSARSVMLCSEIRFSTMPMRSSREPARNASPTSLALTPAMSAMAA
ncbi:hypothetical protein D9M69_526660 [compost metagenome]